MKFLRLKQKNLGLPMTIWPESVTAIVDTDKPNECLVFTSAMGVDEDGDPIPVVVLGEVEAITRELEELLQ